MGFSQVIELPLYKWLLLTPKLEIYCGSVGSMDSFIAFRDRESKECILNTNDCVLNMDQIRYIKRCIGNVSVLFTQFSFAEWAGNDYDETHGSERKIGQFTQQIEVFKPEFTAPTASYVYFCNEENRRMNPWMNTPDTIAELNLKGINIMYPGDEWDSNVRIFNSDCAREKYRADYANIKIDHTPDPVDIAQISQAIERRLQETRSKLPKLLFNRVTPFTIHIHDLGKVVEVDVARGAHKIMVDDGKLSKSARYVMCSQVAWFTFAFSWGLSTLQSSGMYLDRQFEEGNRLYKLQNIVSTEVFRFAGMKGTLRTMHFWWRKKAEMIFRFTGTIKRQGEVSD
jgi:hypothetical protein